MVTEKECKEALDGLRNLERYENFKKWNGQVAPQVKADVIEQLIREHFDNPPLKFEELKENMWVWDNNWNQYFEICEIYPQTKEFDVLIHQNRINKLRYEPMKFEENRFYRKEVKE